MLTTHSMDEAEFLCSRVAIMDRGRIVAMDTPRNLVRALPVPYEVRVETDNGYRPDGLDSLASVTQVVHDDDGFRLRSSDAALTVPALMEWAARSGVRLTHLEVTPADLEDVFLSLTGRALRD